MKIMLPRYGGNLKNGNNMTYLFSLILKIF